MIKHLKKSRFEKKFVYVISIIICFYFSYQIGLVSNKKDALTESFTEMQKTLASNAARRLVTLKKIQNLHDHQNTLRCLLKDEVLHLSNDWKYCISDIECSKNVEGAFYSQTNSIIDSFQKVVCP